MTTFTLSDIPAEYSADPALWHAYRLGQSAADRSEQWGETAYRRPVSAWAPQERQAWLAGRASARGAAA